MQEELAAGGHEVYFVVINAANAVDDQDALVRQCTIPLLQDTEAVGAWGQLGGEKDDFFVLDAHGNVATHLAVDGELATDLSSDEGYANVRDALLAVEAAAP